MSSMEDRSKIDGPPILRSDDQTRKIAPIRQASDPATASARLEDKNSQDRTSSRSRSRSWQHCMFQL